MQQFLKTFLDLHEELSLKKILWNYRPSTFWPLANVKGSLVIMQVGQQELMIPRANLWEGPITWAIDRSQARSYSLYDGPINALRLQFSGAALHNPPKCYWTIETRHHLSEGDRRRGHVQDEAVAVFAGSRHADGVGAQRALKRAGSQRWSVREISPDAAQRCRPARFTCLPRVGTTSGEVLVKDMPWGGAGYGTCDETQLIHHRYTFQDWNSKRSALLQSCFPSEPTLHSVQRSHNGWNLNGTVGRRWGFQSWILRQRSLRSFGDFTDEELKNTPRATTQPMPASLAFLMARSMQKLPTTGPSRFFPFTSAVAALSFSTTGSPSLAQIPDSMSFTYMSARETDQSRATPRSSFKRALPHNAVSTHPSCWAHGCSAPCGLPPPAPRPGCERDAASCPLLPYSAPQSSAPPPSWSDICTGGRRTV